jgi:type IV secretory pathway VirB2 component (pilin)
MYTIFKVNKKIVIGIIVLLLLAAAGYLVFAKKPASSTTSPAQTAVAPALQSFRDLLAKGISQSCKYSTQNSTGTIYMSGGKERGDFTLVSTQTGGTPSTAHMIIMDNTNYLWTDGMKTGVKMAFDPNATPAPSATPATGFDANTKLNYQCSAWVVDSTLFTLPTGISFMAIANPKAAPSAGSNSSLCSKCDTLTGNSKAQCLAALNCQ